MLGLSLVRRSPWAGLAADPFEHLLVTLLNTTVTLLLIFGRKSGLNTISYADIHSPGLPEKHPQKCARKRGFVLPLTGCAAKAVAGGADSNKWFYCLFQLVPLAVNHKC